MPYCPPPLIAPCTTFVNTLVTAPRSFHAAVATVQVYGVHVTDPAPFLSTIVGTSAALVAIIGGLLVARFVSLDSDQRRSRTVLTDATGRLDVARDRAQAAWQKLLCWEADGFFSRPGVVKAVVDMGVTSADDLMLIAKWRYAATELAPFVAEVAKEAELARETLTGHLHRSDLSWDQFRRNNPSLPKIRWQQAWRYVYEGVVEKLAEAEAARIREAERSMTPAERLVSQIARPSISLRGNYELGPPQTDYRATEERRYDELLAAHAQAEQRVEDYEGELDRLQLEHAEIVRPDVRLWWGAVILIIFTILGVMLPLWVMSTGPRNLASVRWVLYPFIGSLAALIGYIVVYLVQLTRNKRGQPTDST
jgi:hypothetical protein